MEGGFYLVGDVMTVMKMCWLRSREEQHHPWATTLDWADSFACFAGLWIQDQWTAHRKGETDSSNQVASYSHFILNKQWKIDVDPGPGILSFVCVLFIKAKTCFMQRYTFQAIIESSAKLALHKTPSDSSFSSNSRAWLMPCQWPRYEAVNDLSSVVKVSFRKWMSFFFFFSWPSTKQ